MSQESNIYFSKDTENAIVLYNNTVDPVEKEKIYNEHIHTPLRKMCEYIFNKYGFRYINLSPENAMDDVLGYVVTKLHLFDPSKNFKAFSYFTIACLHYLQQANMKEYKLKNVNIEIDVNSDSEDTGKHILVAPGSARNDFEGFDVKKFTEELVTFWRNTNHWKHIIKSKTQIRALNNVLDILTDDSGVQDFTKHGIFKAIKTKDPSTPSSRYTTILRKLKTYYPSLLQYYLKYDKMPDSLPGVDVSNKGFQYRELYYRKKLIRETAREKQTTEMAREKRAASYRALLRNVLSKEAYEKHFGVDDRVTTNN